MAVAITPEIQAQLDARKAAYWTDRENPQPAEPRGGLIVCTPCMDAAMKAPSKEEMLTGIRRAKGPMVKRGNGYRHNLEGCVA